MMEETDSNNTIFCRLCANAVMGEFHYIFSSQGVDLARELNACLPITVRNTDPLPKQICDACIETFGHYQRFFYQVLEAEKRLKILWRQTQVIEKSSSLCVDCPLCIEGSMGVKDGRIILGPTGKNKDDHKTALGHVDNECLAQMIKQEIQNEIIPKIENPEVAADENTKFEYVCFTCGEGLISEEEISTHDCVKSTATKQEVNDLSVNDQDSQNIQSSVDVKKSALKRNKNESHADGPTQCEFCGKEYRSYKRLKDHVGFCHPMVYHECDICKMKFSKKWLLTNHMRKHTGEMPYECKNCGKEFVSNSHLWNHKNFHHGKKRLRCNVCKATGFYTKQDLDNHIRTKHTKERRFHCKVCDKSFMSTGVFYQHRFIHTDIRKYACTFCTKTFRRWQTLHNHIRIHTGERPYPCDICGRAFRQRGDMRKHRATQHAETTN